MESSWLSDEFYTFDLIGIRVIGICRKIDLELEFQGQEFFLFLSALYSTRHEGKTFPRNYRSQRNSSLEKS